MSCVHACGRMACQEVVLLLAYIIWVEWNEEKVVTAAELGSTMWLLQQNPTILIAIDHLPTIKSLKHGLCLGPCQQSKFPQPAFRHCNLLLK